MHETVLGNPPSESSFLCFSVFWGVFFSWFWGVFWGLNVFLLNSNNGIEETSVAPKANLLTLDTNIPLNNGVAGHLQKKGGKAGHLLKKRGRKSESVSTRVWVWQGFV